MQIFEDENNASPSSISDQHVDDHYFTSHHILKVVLSTWNANTYFLDLNMKSRQSSNGFLRKT